MIENLVPSVELCQRAKELGWERPTCYYYTHFDSTGEWELCSNMDDKMRSDVYAPMLQEVLEELPNKVKERIDMFYLTTTDKGTEIWTIGYYAGGIDCYRYVETEIGLPNAALRLWCDLQEKKLNNT